MLTVDLQPTWSSLIQPLREALALLPDSQHYRHNSVSEMYGSGLVAARYCGLRTPQRISARTWQHGWISPNRMVHPEIVVMGQGSSEDLHLVAREEEKQFLQSTGYQSEAIGLPFAYALELPISIPERVSGSTLVLPSHSSRLKLLDDMEGVGSFAEFIRREGVDLNSTAVVLHDEDLRVRTANAAWMDYPYAILEGAGVDDASSLLRMRFLFTVFETVICEDVGSSVPMALACGARVTVFPDQRSRRMRSLALEPHERFGAPPLSTRQWAEDTKPELFNPVEAAVEDRAWGITQIGHDNIRDPLTLKSVLGWDRESTLRRFTRWIRR